VHSNGGSHIAVVVNIINSASLRSCGICVVRCTAVYQAEVVIAIMQTEKQKTYARKVIHADQHKVNIHTYLHFCAPDSSVLRMQEFLAATYSSSVVM
jgi:hypothetical protein